jgi:hypothetical protein
MDDERRRKEPPLEIRREFAGGRLETQVLMQAYERVVPVIRRPIPRTPTLWDLIDERTDVTRTQCIAQGA